MAPGPAHLVSTALDRFARVHSTFSPPEAGQDDKGAVLKKVYMKNIPTCIVWDGVADDEAADSDNDDNMRCGSGRGDENGKSLDDNDDDEDVWDGMQVAEDSEGEDETQAHRRQNRRK